MLSKYYFIIFAFSLSCCSKGEPSESVVPYIVPEGMYINKSCAELMMESDELRGSVPELEVLVNNKYREQQYIATAALLVAWPLVFALDARRVQNERLGSAIGRMNTISRVYRKKGC